MRSYAFIWVCLPGKAPSDSAQIPLFCVVVYIKVLLRIKIIYLNSDLIQNKEDRDPCRGQQEEQSDNTLKLGRKEAHFLSVSLWMGHFLPECIMFPLYCVFNIQLKSFI